MPTQFEQVTRGLGRVRSRRDALRLIGGTVVAGGLAFWGITCLRRAEAACPIPSACNGRQYCNEEQTCICILTPEGDHRCGQLPPACEVQFCTTSADCAQFGEGWFCDTPNSGCCNDGQLPRCIAPCGTDYPPEAMRTPTPAPVIVQPDETPTETPDDDAEAEPTAEPTAEPPGEIVLRPSASNQDGLLFYSQRADGSGQYYFGDLDGTTLLPTHVTYADAAGETGVVIVNDDFLPVEWIMADLTAQALRPGRDLSLDPAAVVHSIALAGEESSVELDLRPPDLAAIIARVEALTGETYEEARRFLETTASDWGTLVEMAREPGDDQPRLIAAALALSTANAGIRLLEGIGFLVPASGEPDTDESPTPEATADPDASPTPEASPSPEPSPSPDGSATPEGSPAATATPTAEVSPTPTPSSSRPPRQSAQHSIAYGATFGAGFVMEGMIKSGIRDMIASPLDPTNPDDPNIPTVYVLLCQGATTVPGVCHYMFFLYNADSFKCLNFCATSLDCFSNICMPVNIDLETAKNAR